MEDFFDFFWAGTPCCVEDSSAEDYFQAVGCDGHLAVDIVSRGRSEDSSSREKQWECVQVEDSDQIEEIGKNEDDTCTTWDEPPLYVRIPLFQSVIAIKVSDIRTCLVRHL